MDQCQRSGRFRPQKFSQILALLSMLAVAQPAATFGQAAPMPPPQPATGPGGAEAAFEEVEARRIGEPPTGVWIFSPTGEQPSAKSQPRAPLPVVLFLHGYTALDPGRYRAWIDHIVRRGAVVVYPDYQGTNPVGDDWRTYLPKAVAAVRAALDLLGAERGEEVDT
ncbi:MAG: hypothetical protein M3Q10_20015, partial [Chloroflexota bacterium]|nr:hypothetical protein [Chloroflexota bacterium]